MGRFSHPEGPRRHSTRLKGYDYSGPGAYFITICTQHRELLFGDIDDDVLRPSPAGEVIFQWWQEVNHKFGPTILTDGFILMPNHIHGIIIFRARVAAQPGKRAGGGQTEGEQVESEQVEGDHREGEHKEGNHKEGDHAGSPLHTRDLSIAQGGDYEGDHAGSPLQVDLSIAQGGDYKESDRKEGDHAGSPLQQGRFYSLGDVVSWFKTMTTNAYFRGVKEQGWPAVDKRLWQRSYHDRVIRNEREINRLRRYMENNPRRWRNDKNHPDWHALVRERVYSM